MMAKNQHDLDEERERRYARYEQEREPDPWWMRGPFLAGWSLFVGFIGLVWKEGEDVSSALRATVAVALLGGGLFMLCVAYVTFNEPRMEGGGAADAFNRKNKLDAYKSVALGVAALVLGYLAITW